MRNTGKTAGKVLAGFALAAGMLAANAPKASATPAGLTFYPSTDIYGKNVFHFDADVFTSTSGRGSSFTSEGLEYGLGPDTEKLGGRTEFGFDYVTSSTSRRSRKLLFNAKTQLYANDAQGVRVVGGVWGLGENGGDTSFPPNVGYLLGSKTFSFGRLHLGYAHSFADKNTIRSSENGDDRDYLQFGYDKVFADGKLQFTLDGYTGKSAASVIAPGLVYYFNDKADFQLGFVRYNDKNVSPRNQIYIGFDYNFGKGASTPAPAPAPEDNTKQPITGGVEPERPATP